MSDEIFDLSKGLEAEAPVPLADSWVVLARNAHAAMKRGWWAVRDANGKYVVKGGPGGFNPANTVHPMDAEGNPHRFDDPFEALDAAEQAAKEGGGR